MAWASSRRRAELPSDWSSTTVPRILTRDPTCRLGLADVCTRVATEVDHIGSKLDHSDTNLRGVCRACHAVRTAAQGRAALAQHYDSARRAPERHPLEVLAERDAAG